MLLLWSVYVECCESFASWPPQTQILETCCQHRWMQCLRGSQLRETKTDGRASTLDWLGCPQRYRPSPARRKYQINPKNVYYIFFQLLNKLLNEFVNSWFAKFSRDESFLWEIRERLRFSSSVLLRRILKANIGEIICERLVPIFLRHLDDYTASNGCGSDAEKLATVVSHLGDRIHPAARSRHSELEYLKAMSRTLARLGLYQQELKCKAVSILLVELLSDGLLLTLSDTLCSPFVINTLLWLAAGTEKFQPVAGNSSERVQFLKAFAAKPLNLDQSVRIIFLKFFI